MYPKEEISRLKTDIKSAIQEWGEGKIDQLGTIRPEFKPVSVYLKRGLNNWLAKTGDKIDSTVDNLALFIVDEKGNIDTDTAINDLVSMFKTMDVRETKLGGLTVLTGAGKVEIVAPNHPLLTMLTGKQLSITITAEDLLELKECF